AMMSRCPHPREMIERPDYPSGSHVEAGVAILGAVIVWMGRPKMPYIQLRVCIIDDLVDRRLHLDRIPNTRLQCNMPRRFDHTAHTSHRTPIRGHILSNRRHS